jgi:hypothetical protein
MTLARHSPTMSTMERDASTTPTPIASGCDPVASCAMDPIATPIASAVSSAPIALVASFSRRPPTATSPRASADRRQRTSDAAPSSTNASAPKPNSARLSSATP